jgi:hypothetical protein
MLAGEFEGYQKTMVPVDKQDIDLILDALQLSEHYVNASLADFDQQVTFTCNKYLMLKMKAQIINDLDLIKKCQALLNKK